MTKPALALLATLAACGGDSKKTPDAPMAPAMITISGTASEITATGRTPKQGVAVTAFKVSDDSMIATTTTDAQGNFTITAPTNGSAVDGYVKATLSGLKDTYLYPPAPLTADFSGATVLMLSPTTQGLANQLAGAAAPDATKGWIGVLVVDAANMNVAGATLTASPNGEIHYNGSSGVPQAQATMTAMDGIGYVMNVAAGQVMVGAMKSGTTFKSHSVNARADKITLTIVSP